MEFIQLMSPYRGGGSFSKVGVQFTFSTLSRSFFDRFSKFFFPLEAYENYHLARNCTSCTPASTTPATHEALKQFKTKYVSNNEAKSFMDHKVHKNFSIRIRSVMLSERTF